MLEEINQFSMVMRKEEDGKPDGYIASVPLGQNIVIDEMDVEVSISSCSPSLFEAHMV